MNRLRFWLSSYFGIPKSQANGFIILFPLCFLIVLAPYIYESLTFRNPQLATSKIIALDSLIEFMDSNAKVNKYANNSVANQTEKSRGDQQAKKLSKTKLKNNKVYNRPVERYSSSKKSFYVLKPFDINSADTLELRKIRGIGSVLSKRIVKYRDLLGGFVNKSQFKEVYGLKDSVLLALDTLAVINSSFTPDRININETKSWALARHPYLTKKQAQILINYKQQHGSFQSLNDLKKVKLLDSVTLRRIKPYLNY